MDCAGGDFCGRRAGLYVHDSEYSQPGEESGANRAGCDGRGDVSVVPVVHFAGAVVCDYGVFGHHGGDVCAADAGAGGGGDGGDGDGRGGGDGFAVLYFAGGGVRAGGASGEDVAEEGYAVGGAAGVRGDLAGEGVPAFTVADSFVFG